MLYKTKIAGKECFVSQCHPESGHGKRYMFEGYVCPFCGNDKSFLLEITETMENEKGKLDGYSVDFSCSDYLIPIDSKYCYDCGKVTGLFWCASGMALEEVVKMADEDYSHWKCNKKKGKKK